MPRQFDVCNGDADGLCAALQWRMSHPGPSVFITGLKREIELLAQVHAHQGDEVNVFDLSIQRNHAALVQLLDAGVRVRYFDHHSARDLPQHASFEAHIDASPALCSSLLVDQAIGGTFHAWALVGAYGDNLVAVADRLAEKWQFNSEQVKQLRRMGEAINYNAYGDAPGDVRIAPAQLYALMQQHSDPLSMLKAEGVIDEIVALRSADLKMGFSWPCALKTAQCSVHVLPNAPWSRRVMGALANELARSEPHRAHAVLRPLRDSSAYVVSVRAPVVLPWGAHVFCQKFGGEGRAAAAGIDALPEHELDHFMGALALMTWGESHPLKAPSC